MENHNYLWLNASETPTLFADLFNRDVKGLIFLSLFIYFGFFQLFQQLELYARVIAEVTF